MSTDLNDKTRAIFITREDALQRAKVFLREQTWADEVNEQEVKIIESNECINVLFHYKETRAPQATIICVEKIGGVVSHISLG
ncbi:hypothetical protein KAR34_09465 [bacterium]|nr:hypothetical protein [bacterium]